MPPTLLVISGLPAAGKTTLAQALAPALGWPLVTKDEYKQIACDHLPDLPNSQAGPLSFSLMWHVADVILTAGHDIVLETHFYRSLSPADPPSQAEQNILNLTQRHKTRLLQVFCHAPINDLRTRHAARVASGRRPRIDFPFEHAQLPAHCNWEPLNLGATTPLLRLDTTQPEAAAKALAWVNSFKI